MKILSVLFFVVLVGGFIVFRALDYNIKRKNRLAGKNYCDANGLTFLKAKSYELHTRLYFEKDGIESWANYETDKHYNIYWKKESPLEKIDNKKSKK